MHIQWRLATALRVLIYLALAAVSVLWVLRPVNDPDFFWHLKTGEWIWQHRALPAHDPFNYANQSVEPGGQRFVLTSYWLAQLLYHAVHTLLGFPGIVALRFLVVLLFAGTLLKLRRGDAVVHAALVLCTLTFLLVLFPLDRPQLFSFLFFAAVLVLLERERGGTAPAGWTGGLPIPILMLAWANMHGGHAIGQVLIATYVGMEGVKFAHPGLLPMERGRYRRLLIVGAAGLAASFLNPNTWHALEATLAPLPGPITNIEYFSAARLFRETRHPLLLVFGAGLVLAAAHCLASFPRPDLTRIALLAGTGYWGFTHARLMPFFMVAALPAIGELLSAERFRAWTRPVLAAGSLVLAAYLSRGELPTPERVRLALRVNPYAFPVEAADFVLANDLRGNLYNTYYWGGYLLWRLAPERKVFVDGRNISSQALRQSFSINRGEGRPGDPLPYWKELFMRNGVGYVIVPRVPGYKKTAFDKAMGLVNALLHDPEWVPVHVDAIALVFALRTPAHRDVIARCAVPRETILVWDLKHPAEGER